MRTVVVSGGTDGIGKGLALHYARQGDRVVIVGRNVHKGQQFLDQTRGFGAEVSFLAADLSLVSENRRVVAELGANLTAVDTLVLCAQHVRTTRAETAEGFEHTFALYYLSRYLLGHGLAPLLENSDRPAVLNVCAPGVSGDHAGEVNWADLQLAGDYDGLAAVRQGSRLNDLLGVGFAQQHPNGPARYLLVNPGGVATSFSGEYGADMQATIEIFKQTAKPVDTAIVPMVKLLHGPSSARPAGSPGSRSVAAAPHSGASAGVLPPQQPGATPQENPPPQPLTAFADGQFVELDQPAFDADAARRLSTRTQQLLGR